MVSNVAALVIDVQTGLVSGAYNEKEVLSAIQNCIDKVRLAEGTIVYIQHCHSSWEPLMKGNPGWELHPSLHPRDTDVFIEKAASDAFYETDLNAELQKLGISKLFVMGLQTEFCVDTTCRSALSLGYSVTLIADGHSTGNAVVDAPKIIEHHNATLANLAHPTQQIDVIDSASIEI